jgi:predicted nucleic acid-binding protein
MSAESAVYIDSSALVKLVVREPESPALRHYLRRRPRRVSCGLARVEVVRAVRSQGEAAHTRARAVLERLSLLRLDDSLLDAAAQLDGPSLRSLDAIQLAAAQALGAELEGVVTYDVRMRAAANGLGLSVASPS